MKKLFLSGTGKMGQMIAGLAKEQGIEVVGTADVNTVDALKSTVVQADAVIDFSHRDMLEPLAEFVRKNHMALVCGTTGLEEKHHAILKELSCEVPVLYSANFSIGIAVLRRLAAQAAAALGDSFDIEIVETHHNQKVDAPSGTAKILLDAVNSNGEYTPVYGRQGMCGARTKKEIGMHALRGGTVAGEHIVRFFGTEEEIALSHRADSRRIFAAGALRTAQLLYSKAPGLYTLDGVLFDKL